jgi:hypothetical protein
VAFGAALFFFLRKHSRIFAIKENLENDGVPAIPTDQGAKPIEQLTIKVERSTPVDSTPQHVVFNHHRPIMPEQVPTFKGIKLDQEILRPKGEQMTSP